jgi:peptidoglycan/LPS O-acetylase OafA/YrhL
MDQLNSLMTDKRITPIDGLRGIAILMVLVGHLFIDPFSKQIQCFSPLLLNISKCYPWGVLLFFVVSGFLIGGILLRNTPSKAFVKAFYIRRIIRIWPLYYFLIIFVVGGLYCVNKQLPSMITPFWSYMVFLQNWWSNTQYYHLIEAGVTWTLAIEEQFYLLAPLLLIGATNNKVKIIAAISLVIAFILRIFSHVGVIIPIHNHLFNLSWHNPSFLTYVDVILLGVVGAAIYKSKAFPYFKRYTFLVFPILGLLIYLAAITPTNIWMTSCLPDIVGVLFMGLILLITASDTFINRALCNRVLVCLGQRCYFLYLFHIVVMINIQQTFMDIGWNNMFYANSLSLLLTIAAALLSWKLIEYPLMRYAKSRYPYSP